MKPKGLGGRKEAWTPELIRRGFELFYAEHGRYPTAHEIDAYEGLPSSRQLQRKYGGLPALRESLGLKGPTDFTKGEYRSKTALQINERGFKVERKVYDALVSRFGREFVHREYFFNDDKRTRTDFYVYADASNFMVDVFFPKDRFNLIGCLNSKLKTYKAVNHFIKEKTIFLMMNEAITEQEITEILSRRKSPLAPNQSILTYRQFESFFRAIQPRS